MGVADRANQTNRSDGPTQGAKPAKGAFRPDIEGLRGIAVTAVILYHCGITVFGGGYVGVDVFFVLSGFLITGLLLREVESTGKVSIVRFYGGRAKRLLPSMAVVLVFVSILSWLILSPLKRAAASLDIMASGVYVINWRLAEQAINYFAAGLDASPVQHFWTLAVEEQFYLVWPAVILAVAWWARRSGKNIRPLLAVTLSTIVAASFVYGIYLTEAEAGRAYFSTLTRGWELALGGILALVAAGGVRLSRRLAGLLALAGMAAIVWSVLQYSDQTPFPGYAALLPTLGTAAVIVAGFSQTDSWPQSILTSKVLRHLGRISYTWYLWHWPLLVFAVAMWGDLSWFRTLVVIAVSYVATLITHRLVEEPLRHSPVLSKNPRKAIRLGVVLTVTAVALGGIVHLTVPTLSTASTEDVAGAKQLEQSKKPQQEVDQIRPEPLEATEDRGQMKDDGCLVPAPDTEGPDCIYGDPDGDKTVVLYGDSHAMQWFPALNEVAKDRGWKLVGLTKSGCPIAHTTVYNASLKRGYSECRTWHDNALDRIKDADPDMVFTIQRAEYSVMDGTQRLDRETSTKKLREGMTAALKQLKDITDAKIVVMRDNPVPPMDVPDCVSKNSKDLEQCVTDKKDGLDFPPINAQAAKQVPGVDLINPIPKLCQDGKCPAVIGDALVYRNGSHMTATFVETLSGWLDKQLPTLR